LKLGISTAAFYDFGDTEENALHLSSFPELNTCEVFLETFSEYSADFARLVRENLHGLHVSSVHPKGSQFETELFSSSHRQAEDAIAIFRNVIEAGGELGAKYYVMHGPGSFITPKGPDRIRNLAGRFSELQAIAKQRNMEVLWENVSWGTVRTAEQVSTLRGIIPDIGFVFDIKQAFRAAQDPIEVLNAMGDRLRHIHVLDYDSNGSLCLPGEGCFRWDTLFRELDKIRFDGSIILEPYSFLAKDDERLRRSLRFLREGIG